MFRFFVVVSLSMLGGFLSAAEPDSYKLAAPAGWGGETIALPPGFARDMKLKGMEHIRFAPGMMKADAPSFFTYAFAFELKPEPELTEAVVHNEFLKYYRGLSKAVLNGQLPELPPEKFTLKLKRQDDQPGDPAVRYAGVLHWVEPFATKKPQLLHLELQTWSADGSNYLFACVSPQQREAPIWKQLHAIRDDFLKQQESAEQ